LFQVKKLDGRIAANVRRAAAKGLKMPVETSLETSHSMNDSKAGKKNNSQ
jgi:hypothetical protein